MGRLQYIVSVFFYCHNLSMDMEKFFDNLIESEDLKDIPIDFIFRVVVRVFELINSGEFFYFKEGF